MIEEKIQKRIIELTEHLVWLQKEFHATQAAIGELNALLQEEKEESMDESKNE